MAWLFVKRNKEKRKNCYCNECHNQVLEAKKMRKKIKHEKEEKKLKDLNHTEAEELKKPFFTGFY